MDTFSHFYYPYPERSRRVTSKSEGPVLIENNARVIINADRVLYMDGDTEVEKGSYFEIEKDD